MPRTKQMTDAELRSSIEALEHQIHTWGSMTVFAAKLERLRAEQVRRRQPEVEPVRVWPAKVRARAVVQALTASQDLGRALNSVALLLAQGGVRLGVVGDLQGLHDALHQQLLALQPEIPKTVDSRERDRWNDDAIDDKA